MLTLPMWKVKKLFQVAAIFAEKTLDQATNARKETMSNMAFSMSEL